MDYLLIYSAGILSVGIGYGVWSVISNCLTCNDTPATNTEQEKVYVRYPIPSCFPGKTYAKSTIDDTKLYETNEKNEGRLDTTNGYVRLGGNRNLTLTPHFPSDFMPPQSRKSERVVKLHTSRFKCNKLQRKFPSDLYNYDKKYYDFSILKHDDEVIKDYITYMHQDERALDSVVDDLNEEQLNMFLEIAMQLKDDYVVGVIEDKLADI